MSRRAVPFLVLALLAAGPVAAEGPSKTVEKTLPLSSAGRLSVDTYKGRVTVTAWDREEASIRAVVTPDGSCDIAAELVEKTRIRIEGGGKDVRLVADYDDLPKRLFSFSSDCSSRPFVAWEIRMPRAAALDVKDYKSRISVGDVTGAVGIESYKGTMRLKGLASAFEVETYKGDVVAEFDRLQGRVRAETYKGEIELVVPKDARVDLHENVGRHGVLHAELAQASGGTPVSVETYKGTIRLRSR
jgi:hypothetical protein